MLFATSVLPLGRKDLAAVNIVQRKVLRLIVGWRRISGEDWAETMRRMNARVAAALVQFPMKTWTETIFRHRWRYAAHMVLNAKMKWPRLLAKWIPLSDNYPDKQPYRPPGRPYLRWDDCLHDFGDAKLGLKHWGDLET